MNIGVTVRLDQPITAAAAGAVQAEELGFSSVWLADHYFHRDAAAALSLMMTQTSAITLGTAVMSPYLRHPTLLVSMAESLREIGPDRFILGLGTGGYEFPTEMGIVMKRPLQITRETVQIYRELSQGRSAVTGEYFSAEGSALRWQGQGGPLYLAARGPRMLELSGEIADGIITHGISRRHIDFVQEKAATGAAKRTDGRRATICLMLDVEINDDRDLALAALRPRCLTMSAGAYADNLIEIYGLDPAEVATARASLRSGNRELAASQVTDTMAQAFGLAGTADEVAANIKALADMGVDDVIISVGGATPEETTRQLTELAKALNS